MQRTRIAVLGTLAEFHEDPVAFDLDALVRLVAGLQPDLLCLDITPEQWQQQDFSDLPAEYREALLPLAHQTDIVVVPIGGEHPFQEPTAKGWRGRVISMLRRWIGYIERTSPSPDAINQGFRHFLANVLYEMAVWLAEDEADTQQYRHTDHLIRQVVEVVRRDPGRRILVVINVRHCHHIRPALRKYPEMDVVGYAEL